MKCPNCNKQCFAVSMLLDMGTCPLCAKKGVFKEQEVIKAIKLNKEVF